MRLPGAQGAIVDPAKVRDHMLSPSHPFGWSKARFFRSLGYAQGRWMVLAADLGMHAIEGVVREVPESPYGRKFEVRGILTGPNGRRAAVVSVWILMRGARNPRLLTAYPA